jgi:hypothetical protein
MLRISPHPFCGEALSRSDFEAARPVMVKNPNNRRQAFCAVD